MNVGKEKLKESMSALMDNEANEFEFRRVLKECENNEDLKLKWGRFHLLSAAIRGELDNSINAGFSLKSVIKEESEGSIVRPDLLSRINAELDGMGENATSSSLVNKSDGGESTNRSQTGAFRRLGQGAIAASVAAIVLIAGGSLNPMMSQEVELRLAGQSEVLEDSVPEFDDAYSPSEFSRVPRLNTEFAGTESLNEAGRVRLRQAVFQEFVGEPQESVEVLVNFNVIIEEE